MSRTGPIRTDSAPTTAPIAETSAVLVRITLNTVGIRRVQRRRRAGAGRAGEMSTVEGAWSCTIVVAIAHRRQVSRQPHCPPYATGAEAQAARGHAGCGSPSRVPL